MLQNGATCNGRHAATCRLHSMSIQVIITVKLPLASTQLFASRFGFACPGCFAVGPNRPPAGFKSCFHPFIERPLQWTPSAANDACVVCACVCCSSVAAPSAVRPSSATHGGGGVSSGGHQGAVPHASSGAGAVAAGEGWVPFAVMIAWWGKVQVPSALVAQAREN